MSGVMGHDKWLELEEDIKSVPREQQYRGCCCWLGYRIQLNAEEIAEGNDLFAACKNSVLGFGL